MSHVGLYKYHAFISYARENKAVADDLYVRLTRWRAPSSLMKREGRFGKPPRRLGVYLDRKSQESGGALSSGLREKLEQSAFLIVLCSPAATDPNSWVTREIEHFLTIAPATRIIPVILRGHEDQPLEKVLPAPLLELGEDAPVGADLIHDGGIVPVTHKIIGGLTGFSQNEIAREQEIADRNAQRNARRIIAVISLLFIAASVSAVNAMRQRNQAFYQQAANLAEKARGAIAESATDFAMLLALEGAPTGKGTAFERPENEDVIAVLPSTVYNNRITLVLPSRNGAISRISISNDGAKVARIVETGAVQVVDVESGDRLYSLSSVPGPIIAVFSPGGDHLVRAAQGSIEIFDAVTGVRRAALPASMPWPQIFFSRNGRYLYAADQATRAFAGWALETGEPLDALPAGALLTTDSVFNRAILARQDGSIMIVDLNEARSDGILTDSAGGNEILFANALQLRLDEPVTNDPFDQFYQEWAEKRRVNASERAFENASKISNFSEPLVPGGQAQPVQFAGPDRQYRIAGDTVIELVAPSGVDASRPAFPKFTIIDAVEGKRLRTINGFPVNISQSGDMVFYVAQSDCELKVYIRSEDDVKSVREQIDGCNNAYSLSQLYLSPDDNYAVAGFVDGIYIYSLHSLQNDSDFLPVPVPLFHESNERVIAAGFDAQSKVAYTFTDNGGRLWEPATGDPLGRINGVLQWVDAQGRRLVTLGEDRAARVIDLDLLPVRETWPGAAFIDPTGRRALMADSINIDSFIPYVLDIGSGERIAELEGVFNRPVAHAGISRDSTVVATLSTDNDGNFDNYVALWDGVTGAPLGAGAAAPPRIVFPAPIASFMLAAEANLIVAVGVNNVWYGYDLSTGRERWRNSSFRTHQMFGQTENLELVLLGDAGGKNAIVWSVLDNRIVTVLPPGVTAIASSPDNSLIAAASGNAVALYRRGPGEQYSQIGVYSDHNAQISGLRISSAGDKILSTSADRTTRLWNAATGETIRVFQEPDYPVTSAIFNHSEDRVITTSTSGFARVWDAASGAEISALQVESAGAPYSWSARLSADERDIIVSTIRSTRRFELPPQYKDLRATIKAACKALPKGASLDTDFARERYKLRSAKGVGGNPCEHYGLLHWRYYASGWCSAVGYGCAGESGWMRRRFADAAASRGSQ